MAKENRKYWQWRRDEPRRPITKAALLEAYRTQINAIKRDHDMSVAAYKRYMWRPDTDTGKRELARHERREALFAERLETLYTAICHLA